MWSIIGLVLCVVHVRAGIDYTRCEDNYGYGLMIECTPGFVPIALCTSDGEGRCSGSLTQLRCCQETSLRDSEAESSSQACAELTGSYGDHVDCPSGYMALELCTSGASESCRGAYTRVVCCDDHVQSISGPCNWLYGNYGAIVECPTDQVMIGLCSSASTAACNGAYTGVHCCPVS